ncbi:MAG: hypothetical protein FK731_08265, partial [Asgard group archaeon]|nr:hypothetical protein [Asgard group archaeon]
MTPKKSNIWAVLIITIISISSISVLNWKIVSINSKSEKNIYSCTNIAIRRNDEIFFGNNEDGGNGHPLFLHPEKSVIWFFPKSTDGYGMVHLGWYWQESYNFQGGINEFGLCYDSTGIPELPLNPHPEKPFNYINDPLFLSILWNCRNISEAVAFINDYNFGDRMWYQLFLADATGEAVVVSPNYDGELNFTYKGTTDSYLAQTNFNRIHNESNNGGFPCPRYTTACSMLGNMLNQSSITYEDSLSVMEAVRIKFPDYTAYTNVFDLQRNLLYLVYASQFDEVVTLNMTYELSLPMHEYFLCD